MKKRYPRKIFVTGICVVFLFQSIGFKPILAESLEKEIDVDLEVLPQDVPIFENEEEVFQEGEEADINPPSLEVGPVEKEDSLEPKNETIAIVEESQISEELDSEESTENPAESATVSDTFGTAPWTFDEITGELTIGTSANITAFPGNGDRPNWGRIGVENILKITFLGQVTGGQHVEYTFADHVNVVSIENINLFNISETEDMRSVFLNMKSLTTLDLSSWNTSNVTNMSYMFNGASSLTTLDLSSWDTSKVTNMSYMFNGASSLTTLDLSRWDTGNVTNMRNMFNGASSLTTLDLSSWDTSNVTNMSYMFNGASSLTTLDLSSWDTGNITNMTFMFYDMKALTTLGVSEWNTSNVTDMSQMFRSASSLTTLDLSSWDTGNVTTMYSMFWDVSSLTILDLSEWDTSNVTNMSHTFDSMENLETLDVSGWDTGNVTNMSSMFFGTSSLTEVNKGMWNTSNVTNMDSMFTSMIAIKELDLKEWDTSNVTSMEGMFVNMPALETLDISGFDTQAVTSKAYMFFGNSNLRSLSIGDKFVFQSDAELEPITATDYSGRWIGETTGTVFESSAEFMANKKLGEGDTYTWEKALIEITIPVNMLFHSTRTDSTIVASPNYSITNNSNVSMDVLISQTDSTGLDELESLSLNEVKLVENGLSILPEKTKLMTLDKEDIKQMGFSGEVKPSLTNEVNPSFNLTFKFSISRD